jgi:hypothetical protein
VIREVRIIARAENVLKSEGLLKAIESTGGQALLVLDNATAMQPQRNLPPSIRHNLKSQAPTLHQPPTWTIFENLHVLAN